VLQFRSLTPHDVDLLVDRRPPRPEELAWREARRLRKEVGRR
jgi:hypothetical protein